MVSFECEECGDVVTKKKLENHQRRCYNAPITCIDCHTTFHGNQHKSHTSCISEAQKYEGALYKEKKPKTPRNQQPKTPLNYQQPSVEEEATSSPSTWQVSKVDVPPPAPSPPRAAANPPPNVFDFLVEERSPSHRSARSSSYDSVRSKGGAESSSSSPTSSRPVSKGIVLQDEDITYGGGPVPQGFQKFESDLTHMNVDSQNSQSHQTPAARRLGDVRRSEALLKREGSGQKRKRVEELDLSRSNSADPNDPAPALHSGLTGGLAKLLEGKSQAKKVEASPLSPKKRSKHTTNGDVRDHDEDAGKSRHKRRDQKDKDEDSDRHRSKHKKHRHRDASPPSDVKAIEYPPPQANKERALARTTTAMTTTRTTYTSHSELFVSLIDKSHNSQKGQSIWGTLKTFHDSLQAHIGLESDDYYDAPRSDGTGQAPKETEEKRLLKALRMKVNKHGEVVLFARPDFEVPDEEEVDQGARGARKKQKQIEAA